jgi:hypothetical protein
VVKALEIDGVLSLPSTSSQTWDHKREEPQIYDGLITQASDTRLGSASCFEPTTTDTRIGTEAVNSKSRPPLLVASAHKEYSKQISIQDKNNTVA